MLHIASTGHASKEVIRIPVPQYSDDGAFYGRIRNTHKNAYSTFKPIIEGYEECVKSGNADAMYQISKIYGMYNTVEDTSLRDEWCNKAAKANQPIAREDPLGMILYAASSDAEALLGMLQYYERDNQFEQTTNLKLQELLIIWAIRIYEKGADNLEDFYNLSILYDKSLKFKSTNRSVTRERSVMWGRKALEGEYMPMRIRAAVKDSMAYANMESKDYNLTEMEMSGIYWIAKMKHFKGYEPIKENIKTGEQVRENISNMGISESASSNAEFEAYKEKLDNQERMWNAIFDDGFITNAEKAQIGAITGQKDRYLLYLAEFETREAKEEAFLRKQKEKRT